MSKYNASKTTNYYGTFDSKKEAKRWSELCLLEKCGKIKNLQRQVPYELIPRQYIDGKQVERKCEYVADFVYEENGKTVVEDVKGYTRGQAYALFVVKRKLMLYRYGIRVKEY